MDAPTAVRVHVEEEQEDQDVLAPEHQQVIDDTPMHPAIPRHHRILEQALIRSATWRSGELHPPTLGQCEALFRVSARACCGGVPATMGVTTL